jgi:hypothetical protein
LGAHFIPILQPTLFTESMPDLYERRLATRFGTDLVAAISEIYPKVAERVVSIPGAIDARDALATVSPSPFVDWMHLDARGNGAIADLMFDAVIARVSA